MAAADSAIEDAASRAGRITILVSHRFSTVRMADLIVAIDGARVAEVGSHDELMARGGTYAQLYGIQAAAYRCVFYAAAFRAALVTRPSRTLRTRT